jgi:hypothetical protein
MKKIYLIVLLAISFQSFSQCSYSTIFLFDLGINKFEITKLINTNNSVKIDEGKLFRCCYWDKNPKIKNDSIYRSQIRLNHIQDKCFNGNDNTIYLALADDKLYEISIYQQYSKERYNEMISYYNNYVKLFKSIYPYENHFTTSTTDTHEQIGEGTRFYKLPEPKRNKLKIEEVKISFEANYKIEYNKDSKTFANTNEVDYYKLSIQTVNLNGTKLTPELGY